MASLRLSRGARPFLSGKISVEAYIVGTNEPVANIEIAGEQGSIYVRFTERELRFALTEIEKEQSYASSGGTSTEDIPVDVRERHGMAGKAVRTGPGK